MERRPYYVTLRSGLNTAELREEKGDAHFDFEIQATSEQAHELMDLIERGAAHDFAGYAHSHIPFADLTQKKTELDVTRYDDTLNEIYQKIYDLGNDETKSQIEKLGILDSFNQ
jgi:hypothetical protein